MLKLVLLLFIVVKTIGCASVPGAYTSGNSHGQALYTQVSDGIYAQADYQPGSHFMLPEMLSINVHVDEYEIVDFSVNTDNLADFPDIRFGERYSDGHIILMSFYPSPSVNGSYWLAQVPPIRSGVEKIQASLYRQSVTLSRGLLPPDVIVLDLSIRNGRVERAYIENAAESTIGLKYEEPRVFNGTRFGIITSRMFPQETWRFRFPATDGRFNIAVRKSVNI